MKLVGSDVQLRGIVLGFQTHQTADAFQESEFVVLEIPIFNDMKTKLFLVQKDKLILERCPLQHGDQVISLQKLQELELRTSAQPLLPISCCRERARL